MTNATDPDRDRAGWLEPLRPDDLARARIRGAVMRRAEPLLRRRRRDAVLRTAGSLARLMAPLAAAAVLLFGWVAHRAPPPSAASAGPAAARSPVQVEELVRARDGAPPTMLTSASAPSTDLVLQATLRPGGRP